MLTSKDELFSILLFCGIVLLTCLLASFYQSYRKKLESNALSLVVSRIAVAAPSSLLFGLRGFSVGYDTYENYLSYNALAAISYQEAMLARGGAYQIAMKLLYTIFNSNYTAVLIVIAFTTTLLVINGILNFGDRISLTFGLFVYLSLFGFNSMDQMRQMLAMAIWFSGVFYIINRKPVHYVATTLLASAVHISLMSALALYCAGINESKKNQVMVLFMIVLSLVLSISTPLVFSLIGLFFSSIEYYSNYFSQTAVSVTADGTGMGLGIVLISIPLIIPLLFLNKVPNRLYWLLHISTWAAIPLRMLGYSSYFLSRLYLIPAMVTVIAYAYLYGMLSQQGDGHKAILLLISIPILGFSFVYFSLTSHGIVPYTTIFG